ncbi:unnamed protein product [Blepharisma stoltei]|uniref:Phosphatidylinositol-4-phosphate 5-kinase n=1 Tax=Blepharisma stoltei TaxID=1481888 RepID=A0AAU9K8A7_9CILI|nr:unnamed protein product [Blepharisma stoltei]
MNCCSSQHKKSHVTIRQTEAYLLSHKFRFSPQELLLYQQRFDRMAKGKAFTLKKFRKNMGLLGMKSTRAIADRIFKVMDKDCRGRITFEQFLEYMDILMHGNREEKAYQSFRLIAQKNSEIITFPEFSKYLLSVAEMRNNLTGSSKDDASQEVVKKQFDMMDLKGDGVIDFDEFKQSLSKNKPIFEWLSLARFGVNDRCEERKESTNSENYRDRIESLERKLYSCIELLNAPANEEVSPKASFIRSFQDNSADRGPKLILQQDFERGPKFSSHQEIGLDGDMDVPFSYIDDDISFSDIDTQPVSDSTYSHIPQMKSPEKSISFISDLDTSEIYDNRRSMVLDRLKELARSMHSLKAETLGDEDAQDNPRRRASTRYNVPKKNAEKKKSVIHWGDEDWSLIVSMMLGIQKAVRAAAVNLDPNSIPTPEQFAERSKLNLLPGESSVQSKMCKFRDYSPFIFERIRRRYGISANQYIKSLGVDMIMSSLLQSEFSSLVGLMSSGKSGSFFYYSDDGKYVVKTMTRDEYVFLRKILPEYYEHIMTYPDTLIPRFYGFHKLLSPRGGKTIKRYIIVMGNVFSSGDEIHIRYDLKGSTYGRSTDPNEDFSVARKDLDFNRSGLKIDIDPTKKEKVLQQMERDCEFFVKNDIIDYSLLLGIHHTKGERIVHRTNVPLAETEGGGLMSLNGDKLYFMGIIDILTLYGAKKKLEHLFKGSIYGSSAISCVPSKLYAERFLGYMNTIFTE